MTATPPTTPPTIAPTGAGGSGSTIVVGVVVGYVVADVMEVSVMVRSSSSNPVPPTVSQAKLVRVTDGAELAENNHVLHSGRSDKKLLIAE